MGTVHPLIPEIFGKLIHPVKPANNKPFQVQFVSDPQVERDVQRIVMRDKGTRSGTARYGL